MCACIQGAVFEVLDQVSHTRIRGRDEIHARHLGQRLPPNRHILHHCSIMPRVLMMHSLILPLCTVMDRAALLG